jgi:hypothetical protein
MECKNCKHETPRNSLRCQGCLKYRHFEPKHKHDWNLVPIGTSWRFKCSECNWVM